MRNSIITAIVLAFIGIGWIVSGQFAGNGHTPVANTVNPANVGATVRGPTQVRVANLEAVMRVERVKVTGSTEASRKVEIRAETNGQVREVLRQRGDKVARGAPIARLRIDDRAAKLAEAKATLRQRQIEFDATEALRKKRFRSETEAAAAQARLDAARAIVEQIEIDVARITLRAPFAGMIDSGHIELGDYMHVGDIAATLVDLDPILIVGNIGERQINSLQEGMLGVARLIDGSEHDGIIRFVAPVADSATRTYRVELEIPNPAGVIRGGMTADFEIPVSEVEAHFVAPSTLTLNDDGIVGVKVVSSDNTVTYHPVEIIADEFDGIWLGGLPRNIRLITVGQEFVVDGERVKPIRGRAQVSGANSK